MKFQFQEEASCKECSLYNRIWIPNLVYQKFVDAASKPAMRVKTKIIGKLKIYNRGAPGA